MCIRDSRKYRSKSLDEIVGQSHICLLYTSQVMIGPDGKSYPVPANYASKSKLVEGDILKLTIADDGGFIYKQIGPIARLSLIHI